MVANIDTIAWTGQKPWHGEGVEIDHLMTSAEALHYAKLDWDVELTPPTYAWNGQTMTDPDHFQVVRQDNGVSLGVVGSRYTPVQNTEAFRVVDSICADNKARIEVCGALGKGEKVWTLARIDGDLRIGQSDDVLEPYLLMVNAHNGSLMFQVMLTIIRVVCQNTMAMALAQRAKMLMEGKLCCFRHSGNVIERAEIAREIFGLAQNRFAEFKEIATMLSYKKLTPEELDGYVKKVFPVNEEAKVTTKGDNIRDSIIRLFTEGEGNQMPGVKGSLWAAYNGVTQFVDHHRGFNKTEKNSRFAVTQLGTGAKLKDKAWDVAVSML